MLSNGGGISRRAHAADWRQQQEKQEVREINFAT